jgi:hypothetical protein
LIAVRSGLTEDGITTTTTTTTVTTPTSTIITTLTATVATTITPTTTTTTVATTITSTTTTKPMTKLLVTAGNSGVTEIIDLTRPGSSCKNLPLFPVSHWKECQIFVYGAIGGLGFEDEPIICGGGNNNAFFFQCYTLEGDKWKLSQSLNTPKQFAGKLMIFCLSLSCLTLS